MIKQRWNLQISHSSLKNFYKYHGIRWLTVGTCYAISIQNMPQLTPQRHLYARLLSNIILANKPLIYCDESSMNCWDLPKKTWSYSTEEITIPKNDSRLSVTLYAAISPNALSSPVFYLSRKTTNQQDFRSFLIKIKENVKSTITSKPFLVSWGQYLIHLFLLYSQWGQYLTHFLQVFDGHSSHKTKSSM